VTRAHALKPTASPEIHPRCVLARWPNDRSGQGGEGVAKLALDGGGNSREVLAGSWQGSDSSEYAREGPYASPPLPHDV
jgi:hypothetical protein